jgi:hypothetical protein
LRLYLVKSLKFFEQGSVLITLFGEEIVECGKSPGGRETKWEEGYYNSLLKGETLNFFFEEYNMLVHYTRLLYKICYSIVKVYSSMNFNLCILCILCLSQDMQYFKPS